MTVASGADRRSAEEIRAQVDEMAPRTHPDGSINTTHVAIEQTLRERHGHPSYIADLDGPGRFRAGLASGHAGHVDCLAHECPQAYGAATGRYPAASGADREACGRSFRSGSGRYYDCERTAGHDGRHSAFPDEPAPVSGADRPTLRDRYWQCDDTCTVDCGACKGQGRPTLRDQLADEAAKHEIRIEDLTREPPEIVWHVACGCGWDGGPCEVGRGLDSAARRRWQLHQADALLPVVALATMEAATADLQPLIDELGDLVTAAVTEATCPGEDSGIKPRTWGASVALQFAGLLVVDRARAAALHAARGGGQR